tara:strand:+ start:63 stop:500 length:438 start_codon:yes stop_codon:yes gene_type:complete
MTDERKRFWLTLAIRLNAAWYVSFFSVGVADLLLHLDLGPWINCRVKWGSNGEAYELMFCALYIPWGVFLWRAARDPWKNATFLDFTVAAGAAHFGTMFFESLIIPGEHPHLSGDVLAFSTLLLLLAVTWLPARRRGPMSSAGSA